LLKVKVYPFSSTSQKSNSLDRAQFIVKLLM